MALGKFNFRATVREQSIHKLDEELRVIDLYKGVANVSGNEAEAYFRAWVKGRHGHRLLRSGWPDFLLEHKETGKPFAVEVKTAHDSLSRGQHDCFIVLERAGLPVYIWQPENPKVLTPWRSYFEKRPKFRAPSQGQGE